MPAPHPDVPALAELRPRRHEAEVLGARTAWWEYGDPEASVTLVAVHGFRGEHHGLEPVLALLPGLRVIAPDLPGFGDSAPIPGRTHDLALYAEWLTGFVAAVAPPTGDAGAARIDLLGHSFGSIVASAAVAGGLAVRRLVLVNPIGAPALEGPRGILTRLAVLYYRAGAALPRPLGEGLLRNPAIVRASSVAMVKTHDGGLRRFVHDQHRTYFSRFADRDVLAQAFDASVSHDVSEFAGSISVPTLLVAAERDDITPIQAERRLKTLFADARLVEIPHVGHLIHYETPHAAARAISDFLSPPSDAGTR